MNADPLATLRDIYLPAAPQWWPPAPGWWLLALLLLAILYWIARWARAYWHATRPIRAAKRIVDALIEDERNSTTDDVMLANQCNEVLKRLLVVALGITQLSKASGDDWLTALDQLGGCSDFSQGPGQALGEARFAPDFATDRRTYSDASNAYWRKSITAKAVCDWRQVCDQWLWPWALAALPLPWLWRLTARHTRQQPALSVPSMDDFAAVTETEHSQAGQSAWRLIALCIAWALLWQPWPDRNSPAIRLTCRPRAAT